MIRISERWQTPFVMMPGVGPIYKPRHFETTFAPNIEAWLLNQGYAEEVTSETGATAATPVVVATAASPIVPDNDQVIAANTVKEPEAVIAATKLASGTSPEPQVETPTQEVPATPPATETPTSAMPTEAPTAGNPDAPPEPTPEVTQTRSNRRKKAEPNGSD